MDAARWEKIERAFRAAVDAAPAERARILDEACDGDRNLRAEVEAMVAAHVDEDELSIESWLGRRGGVAGGEDRARVGPYDLLRVLGEGGMGVVWLAEQTSPIRRQVAVKIIKLGMDTEQVVSRFDSERQTLAMMAHPAIAHVYDAGATPDGRPYFAMELIEGEEIHRYCDRRRWTTRRRIELFLDVCAGVSHAHQKGIIHRDLKPSNVLVTGRDDEPGPKIIDFGIAKATDDAVRAPGLVTATGHVLGTPLYMSPEQAGSRDRDVDTRTDVYSLGVMLYELLAGTLPADPEEISDHALRRSLDRLRFPRPSVRLTRIGETGSRAARDRGTTLDALIRTLRGDLDWIVVKAIEKDRSRRYPTVDALAADLRRYLAHEPVEARPPSRAYALGKFVRRHRVGVATAAAILLAVLAGAGLATYGMIRALAAEEAARRDAETAQRIQNFVVGIFDHNDPYSRGGRSVSARTLLDEAAARIGHELTAEPELRTEVMEAVGMAYMALGAHDRAEPILASVLEQRQARGDGGSVDLASALENVGQLRVHQGRYDEAADLLERALAMKEAALGADDAPVAWTLSWLSRAHAARADRETARALAERALAIHRTHSVERGVVSSLRHLGSLAEAEGRHDDGVRLHEEAHAIARKALGEDHPMTLDLRESMALADANRGDLASAERAHRQLLEARVRVFGPTHPTVAYSYHNLGRTLARLGRNDEAIPMYERSVEIRETALGPDHPAVAHSLDSLAIAEATAGNLDRSEEWFHRALAIYRDRLGLDHPETLETMQNLSILAAYQGNDDLALDRMEEAIALGYDDLDILLAPPLDAYAGRSRYDRLIERVRRKSAGP